MAQQPAEPSPAALEILGLRLIATLGTVGEDGAILLTPVWYMYEDGRLYIPTGGGSRKVRNVRARPGVTVLVDQRHPTNHRWASAVGAAEIIAGPESQAINTRVRERYVSAAGDETYGRLIEAFDDVTLVVTPSSWRAWTPRALAELAERHGRSSDDIEDWFTPWD